eukprot:351879-Chlamydomonas_euryale.AAC.13
MTNPRILRERSMHSGGSGQSTALRALTFNDAASHLLTTTVVWGSELPASGAALAQPRSHGRNPYLAANAHIQLMSETDSIMESCNARDVFVHSPAVRRAQRLKIATQIGRRAARRRTEVCNFVGAHPIHSGKHAQVFTTLSPQTSFLPFDTGQQQIFDMLSSEVNY